MGQCLEGHPRRPLREFSPTVWACRHLRSPTSAALRLARLSQRLRATFVKTLVPDVPRPAVTKSSTVRVISWHVALPLIPFDQGRRAFSRWSVSAAARGKEGDDSSFFHRGVGPLADQATRISAALRD